MVLAPAVMRSGARSLRFLSISVADFGSRLANAASNSTCPAPGTAYRSQAASDCSWLMVLPKAYRKSSGVNGTARCRFAGLCRIEYPERSVLGGSLSTPRTGAGCTATTAAPRRRSSSNWAIRPPNEWPMMIGGRGRSLMIAA